MTDYDIRFAASAAKEFEALPSNLQARVTAVVDSLAQIPRPRGVRKLAGHDRTYRVRVGHYRVVYEVDDATRSILVTVVRHRRDAYR